MNEWAPGIPKSPFSATLTSWELDPKDQELLEKYYLLHWESNYFWHKYHEGSGILLREGIYYSTIFFEGVLPPNRKIVLMSFRKPKGFPMGYVLVRPKKGLPV